MIALRKSVSASPREAILCLVLLIVPLSARAQWTSHPSDGVEMKLTREGDANRLDFDFRGHAGYAIARQDVDRDLPDNYQFVMRIKGHAPKENLELKLLHGDDVWWLNRRDVSFSRDWTTLKTKKRQLGFAWGPSGGGEIRHVDSLEVVVTAGSGGKGTVWFTDPALEPLPPTPTEALTFTTRTIDFGAPRELGGLTLDWKRRPASFRLIVDGHTKTYTDGSKFVWLPDAEARMIRIEGGELRGVTVEPPTWAATVNDFWSIVARDAKRGEYPRYLLGEQSYWTVVGADKDVNEALVGEDGNIEPFKGGFSIEPFVTVGGKKYSWADVDITHSLEEGDLPIPAVSWKSANAQLSIKAAVSRTGMLQIRYRARTLKANGSVALTLQVRPFQVNPSTQFLNLTGGATTIDEALVRRIHFSAEPNARETHAFTFTNRDAVEVDIPLREGAQREPFAGIAGFWREQVHRTAIDLPAAPEIGDSVRANLAWMLIHRDGAALQPGSRSYERAWIRDGALMAAVLLRLGHADAAKEFAAWYVKYQYEDGKVPCCVDRRGADPVPENDSHGELIYLVAEIERITHDEVFVRKLWPNVDAAARYIQKLRAANHGPFEGLLTESISHEGYSAKPMHSYWDDVFGVRGLDDAAYLATKLGFSERAGELSAQAASFRRDFTASVRRTIEAHHLDYVPGSAELGDFDATSTAIAISPLNLGGLLPAAELKQTFDRYLTSLGTPRKDYTPYEMRIIGALIRLGRTGEGLSLIPRFLKDRRPLEWNEWAEVVATDPRAPTFIGDMPHAWVASDFIRSIVDAFAYDAEDGTLVIAAGLNDAWLAKPLHVGPIATYSGTVDVRAYREGARTIIEVTGTATPKRMVVAGRVVEPKLPARVVRER